MSLAQIIETSTKEPIAKPKKYGINQIRDNIEDPVRLAVKEVQRAERQKQMNVQAPGPGHYNNDSQTDKKSFSVKPGQFISNQRRFKTLSLAAAKKDDLDPNLPIYDLQMQEGPQMKARLLMRELQLAEDESQIPKPKVFTGSAFKSMNSKLLKDLHPKNVNGDQSPDMRHSATQESNIASMVQSSNPKEGLLSTPAAQNSIPSEVFNFQSEVLLQDYLKKKGELVNSIRQNDNLVSFNSSSPRFETQKQIQIITGQDPETGNLYIIKDDKTNLGPGYYKNHEDIQNMKQEF